LEIPITGRQDGNWLRLYRALREQVYTFSFILNRLPRRLDDLAPCRIAPADVPLTTVRCYPCRGFLKTLLAHGGDTGSIPVRDANNLSLLIL